MMAKASPMPWLYGLATIAKALSGYFLLVTNAEEGIQPLPSGEQMTVARRRSSVRKVVKERYEKHFCSCSDFQTYQNAARTLA